MPPAFHHPFSSVFSAFIFRPSNRTPRRCFLSCVAPGSHCRRRLVFCAIRRTDSDATRMARLCSDCAGQRIPRRLSPARYPCHNQSMYPFRVVIRGSARGTALAQLRPSPHLARGPDCVPMAKLSSDPTCGACPGLATRDDLTRTHSRLNCRLVSSSPVLSRRRVSGSRSRPACTGCTLSNLLRLQAALVYMLTARRPHLNTLATRYFARAQHQPQSIFVYSQCCIAVPPRSR